MTGRFDLAIVGGGTVGSTLALLVSAYEPDARILLVDKGRPPPPHKTFSVTFGSRLVLEDAGAWDGIGPHAHPITGAEISLDGSFGMLRLDRSDLGEDSLCHSVPAADMDRALRETVGRTEGIEVLQGELASAASGPSGAALKVGCGDGGGARRIEAARCVITACSPGPLSRSGFRTVSHDYGQAIVSCVTEEQPADPSLAVERFGPDGVYACVPRRDGCGLVACLRAEEADRAGRLAGRELAERIVPFLGPKVFGRTPPVKSSQTFPLALRLAFPAHLGNVCLVGSALQSVHPVGAQGMNLALRDASVASKLLCESAPPWKADSGGVFRRLARVRRADRSRTVLSTHAIAKAAMIARHPLRDAGGAALMAMSLASPVRRLASRSIFLGRMPA